MLRKDADKILLLVVFILTTTYFAVKRTFSTFNKQRLPIFLVSMER